MQDLPEANGLETDPTYDTAGSVKMIKENGMVDKAGDCQRPDRLKFTA